MNEGRYDKTPLQTSFGTLLVMEIVFASSNITPIQEASSLMTDLTIWCLYDLSMVSLAQTDGNSHSASSHAIGIH